MEYKNVFIYLMQIAPPSALACAMNPNASHYAHAERLRSFAQEKRQIHLAIIF
jgi:hypothetical protein